MMKNDRWRACYTWKVAITVTYAGEIFWGYGKHIIIDHGDHITSLYCHLDKIYVYKGQKVKTGEIIGREGSTGWRQVPICILKSESTEYLSIHGCFWKHQGCRKISEIIAEPSQTMARNYLIFKH